MAPSGMAASAVIGAACFFQVSGTGASGRAYDRGLQGEIAFKDVGRSRRSTTVGTVSGGGELGDEILFGAGGDTDPLIGQQGGG